MSLTAFTPVLVTSLTENEIKKPVPDRRGTGGLLRGGVV